MNGSRVKRILFRSVKICALVAAIGILGVAALLSFAWVERRTDIALPVPTGLFAVGRDYWTLADDTQSDPLAPAPGAKRELLVWMWYPATARGGAVVDDYYPAMRVTSSPPPGPRPPLIARILITLFGLMTHDASKVHGHSFRNADVSPQQRSYPVVIMRAGGSAGVLNLSTLAEDLASHGYIVAGFDAPYRTGQVTFPDGRVIRRTDENNPELGSGEERIARVNRLLAAWTADMSFVLDGLDRLNTSNPPGKFTGRLDTKHIGAFGHSFGGAQAAQFCQQDSRCTAGIDVDGMPFGSVIRKGVPRPFMFIVSQQIHDHDPESLRVKTDIQSIYDRLPANDRFLIAIRGSNHFTFTDDGAVFKGRIMRGILRLFGKLKIDGRRQLAVTAYCIHSFFDSYLKGTGSQPSFTAPAYPEIEIIAEHWDDFTFQSEV